jgi:predicted nucleotidyltransferase
MAASPAQGLARLREAAESGELDEFCQKHHIRILTVFGSTARGEPTARDLDIGIMTEPGTHFDIFTAVYELMVLTRVDNVDVAHLNRGGPVIRERALVGSSRSTRARPMRWRASRRERWCNVWTPTGCAAWTWS